MFREKAAKEAGVEDEEDEENEDDDDVMGGPFRNINDQIVSFFFNTATVCNC